MLDSIRPYLTTVMIDLQGGDNMAFLKALMVMFVALLGGTENHALLAVGIFWCLDFLLGFLRACFDPKKKLSSRKMFLGLLKGLVYVVVLCVSWQLRQIIPVAGSVVGGVLDIYVALTEAISVLRNACGLLELSGSPMPGIERIANLLERESDREVDILVTHANMGIVIENAASSASLAANEAIANTAEEIIGKAAVKAEGLIAVAEQKARTVIEDAANEAIRRKEEA